MNKISIAIIVLCVAIFNSCHQKDKDDEYFNGQIRRINTRNSISKNVTSHPIALYGRNYGEMTVYDSIMIYWNPMLPDYFYNVFNVDSGKEIGSFCLRGRGPKEATSLNMLFQLFKNGDDIMSLLKATNENKLFFWNISRSLNQKGTVYDTIVPYANRNRDKSTSYFQMFYQSDSTLLAAVPPMYLSKFRMTTPSYMRRTIYTDKLLEEYPIYKITEFENKKSGLIQFNYFYSYDAIKPDGSKIVQAMYYLPQINIIDTKTGSVVGYRSQESQGFSLFETDMDPLYCYYNSVQADDKYIYATYWGKEVWNSNIGSNEIPDSRIIHIYDWEGNQVYELTTDRPFFRIYLDPIRNRLYTSDISSSEVAYLDLNELAL
jgi:hypothetical protein